MLFLEHSHTVLHYLGATMVILVGSILLHFIHCLASKASELAEWTHRKLEAVVFTKENLPHWQGIILLVTYRIILWSILVAGAGSMGVYLLWYLVLPILSWIGV